MKFTDSMNGVDAPVRTFLMNTTLAVLEYILTEGVDGVLDSFVGVNKDDIRVFPHVMEAMREKGLLQGV